MRVVFALVLLIGMGLAGFAVYMAQGRFSEYQTALATQEKALKNNVPLVRVFVASHALRYGELLKKTDVRIVAWPKNAIPQGAFTDPKVLFPNGDRKLRTVLRAMEKDEAILAVKVTKPGEDASVASRLSPGMRAFTIRVDVASGVSGFLRPGNKVDVYWTGRVGKRDVTRLILEGIKLIAIDQKADAIENNPVVARTVTAEVSPKVVAALVQAQATGRLLLALRGNSDTTNLGQIEVDQAKLLGIKTVPVKIPTRKKVCTIKIRKGENVVDVPIPCSSNQ